MNYKLTVICGETTCYDFDSKNMCKYVLASHFGTRLCCGLFREIGGDYYRLNESNLNNLEKSYLLRHELCLKILVKE